MLLCEVSVHQDRSEARVCFAHSERLLEPYPGFTGHATLIHTGVTRDAPTPTPTPKGGLFSLSLSHVVQICPVLVTAVGLPGLQVKAELCW